MEPEITEDAVNGAPLSKADMILVNMVYQMVSAICIGIHQAGILAYLPVEELQ